MKILNNNKLKSLLLTGALSLSLFFGGCTSDTNKATVDNSNITIQSDNITEEEVKISSTLNNANVPSGAVEVTVEKVVDGDTLKVKLKDTNEIVTVRLLLIDTPESVKVGVKPQPYAMDASNYGKKLLSQGDTVYMEYDGSDKTDKYKRHLAYLWFYNKETKDWQMYNEKIVENGLARVGYIYSQKKYLNLLNRAQDKAKSERLNIWSVEGYVTKDGFDVEAYNRGVSSPSSPVSGDKVVYVKEGLNKYHSSEHAHNMKGAVKMSEFEAKTKGYEPCKTCYK